MSKIFSVLFATTAIGWTLPAFADGTPMTSDSPVISGAPKPSGAPAANRAPAEFEWIEMENGGINAPGVPATAPDAPANPLMDGYPSADAPKRGTPKAGEPRYLGSAGQALKGAPAEMHDFKDGFCDPAVYGFCPQTGTPDPRRGHATGDDGVLEAIQDRPIAVIRRRGGETPGSAMGYSHPDDIRRANSLEDRRIPHHEVGKFRSNDSPLWHADPSNPYEDPDRAWAVKSGLMLSQLLINWSRDAGWTVAWRTETDYLLRADVVIKGSFAEAAGEVVASFANATPPIVAEFYFANKVIVVRTADGFDGR